MTLVQLQTLADVIDEGLDRFKGAPCRVIREWIKQTYPEVLAVHQSEINDDGLDLRIRMRRKTRSPVEEIKSSRNLCLDLGLPELQLDTEISIPLHMDDPVYGGSTWKEVDEASLEDIDKHIFMLEAQAAANLAKADNWRRVRQAAAQHADGGLTLTLGELRLRAARRA